MDPAGRLRARARLRDRTDERGDGARRRATVVGVDRAPAYLERASARDLRGARFLEADVVELDLGEKFDHVVLANIVHEVPDAGALFATATRHLGPDGCLHVSLQNPQSIHRLVGQEMGVISQLDEVSDRGRQYETLELYGADDLAAFGAAVGLTVAHRAGVMLKPLPNDLMADLPEPILEGFVRAAHHLPDHCAMNYLVLRRPGAAGHGGR